MVALVAAELTVGTREHSVAIPVELAERVAVARPLPTAHDSVTVRVMEKLYETGRKVSEAFKKKMPIVFEPILPKWNYWAMPQ